ncbi:MAG: cysteine desulfurase family protein [Candidatus Saccharimonadales bacterium]
MYLDHSATTPMSKAVLAAMQPYFEDRFYNPSSTYLPAKEVRGELQKARATVAEVLGAKPQEIYFVSGGTEGNNTAIQGVLRAFPNSSVTISGVEHDSVRKTAEAFNCSVALSDKQGRVDMNDLRQKITDTTVLVSVMYANNEVGTVQPIRQIASLVAEMREARKKQGNTLPLYLHTDACQAANYLDLHVSRLGVDMMTLGGGKIYGPKQSGVLYVSSKVDIEPLMYGGGQERGLRSGTENIAGDIGFATALRETVDMREAETTRLSAIQTHFAKTITQMNDQFIVNGSLRYRLPNNVHVTFPGVLNETLLLQLEQAGFLAAAGSACSASHDEPSHVLRAMGISDKDAQSSLRFTFGRTTTQQDIDNLLATLRALLSA